MAHFTAKKFIFALSLIIIGLAFFHYADSISNCAYTETELELAPEIAEARLKIIKGATQVHGKDKEYRCLKEMSQIENILVTPDSATNYKYQIENIKYDHLAPNSDLEFTAIKLMSVSKHGLATIDSGKGPIQYLILKSQNGTLYSVATVSLGLNAGDEFLKAKTKDREFVLTPRTRFQK